MTNIVLVTIVNCCGDLTKYAPCLIAFEALPLTQKVVQFPAGRNFHDEHHLLLILEYLIDVNNVWVLNRGHDLNFPPDANEVILGLDFRLFDGFNGNLQFNAPSMR